MAQEQHRTDSQNGSNGAKRPAKRNEGRRKRRRRGGKQVQKSTGSGNQQPSQEKKRRPEHSHAPIIVPKVQEPVPECAFCEKPIEAIAQAISGAEPGIFYHFDCVLRKIAEDEKLAPTQKVSYIGKGVFAVVDTDTDGKFIIVKRIPFESPENFAAMKQFVEEQKR
ncbi:MAG TPA: hypothetical protein VKZ39_01670 [Sphaerochaetaceae bacterium]|jgi:hypothetical protein|nr:hypothetical protein [Sphaerochaetaceae bacterium]